MSDKGPWMRYGYNLEAERKETMLTDQESIAEMASDLALALVAEYMAKTDAEKIALSVEFQKTQFLLEAYESGQIDGKNADIRRYQEAKVLSGTVYLWELRDRAAELKMCAAVAEAERRGHEALIGLTKAWLYSQSGK